MAHQTGRLWTPLQRAPNRATRGRLHVHLGQEGSVTSNAEPALIGPQFHASVPPSALIVRRSHAGNPLTLASAGKEISSLPPPARKRHPHLASSRCPFATPPARLPLPSLSAQRKCERQPQRGSRCLLEHPLFRVRSALLPTA